MASDWSGEPKWRLFEKKVAKFLIRLYPDATVSWNVRLRGEESGRWRQIDVLVGTRAAGINVPIVVECKYQQGPVGIKAVDEFIGKLRDLGIAQGILWSASGFTADARSRASGTRFPCIELKQISFPVHHIVHARGPLTWRMDNLVADMQRSVPWVQFPASAVLSGGGLIDRARGLLLVENHEIFQRVTSLTDVTNRWLCLWASGWPGGHAIDFLRRFDSIPLAAWCDADADGTHMIDNLSERVGRPVTPVGMGADLWRSTPKRPQAPDQLRRARGIAASIAAKRQDKLGQLAAAIATTGEGCEQEAVAATVLPALLDELRLVEEAA